MESFAKRLQDLWSDAMLHIVEFMKDKDSHRFVTKEQEEECAFDDTVGIAFFNRHGHDDYAHVTRIFKDEFNSIWVEGLAYNDGQILKMELNDASWGDIPHLADICH